jgi:hypothetical protein
MAQAPNWKMIGQQMKEKGLSCNVLKSMVNQQLTDSKKFRELNLNNIALAEEQVYGKLKELHSTVCALE